MNLHNALFNWLQIKIVLDARPDDRAAKDTLDFFAEILQEDHKLAHFQISQVDDTMYHIQYETEGVSKNQKFDRDTSEQLLSDIISNPKYNE